MSQTEFTNKEGETVHCDEQLYDQIAQNEALFAVDALLQTCHGLLNEGRINVRDDDDFESWREIAQMVKGYTDQEEE